MSTEMADPPKLELPEKTVQEIVLGGEEVPERYMLKDAADLHSVSAMDCPLIDLSLLSSPITRSNELEKLRSALSSWGFFQLMNHGVERKMMDQMREMNKQFFALPKQEKQRYSRDVHLWEGYGNDAIYEDQSINWNDRLYLRVFPESQRNLKLWPQNPPTFREVLEEYATKTRRILETLVKAMATLLNLNENAFLASFGDEKKILMFARFNYYPACPAPEQILGFRPHSDGTALTMLLQDSQVEGLQVQKDGTWFQVPAISDALLVNVGDQMEVMSNGVFKSVVHRVVADPERERVSVAMLFIPAEDAELGPLKELVNEDRPQMYKRVKGGYGKVYFRHCSKGMRQIDSIKAVGRGADENS